MQPYISERVVNIGELKGQIRECYYLAQKIQKQSPHNEDICELVKKLEEAVNFEFCIERYKTINRL